MSLLYRLPEKLHFLILLLLFTLLVSGIFQVLYPLYQKSIAFNLFCCGFFLQGFFFLFLGEFEIYFPFGRQAGFGYVERALLSLLGEGRMGLLFAKAFPPATLLLTLAIPLFKDNYRDLLFVATGFFFSHHFFVSYSDLSARQEKESLVHRTNSLLLLSMLHLVFLCLLFKLLVKDPAFQVLSLLPALKGDLLSFLKLFSRKVGLLWAKL